MLCTFNSEDNEPAKIMIDFIVEPSQTTPYVSIDSQEGVVAIEGKSLPENALNFYMPIIDKIHRTFSGTDLNLRIELSLSYFNTSSSKCLFNLLRRCKELEAAGTQIIYNWYYEEDDEDMREAGEDYADILELHFNYVSVDWMPNSFLRQAV